MIESRPLSRWLLLAAIAAGFAWTGTTRVESNPGTASVEIARVSGELQLTNSRADQAIFQATGLAPGGSITGTVQLSNTGSLAGELGLAQLNVQDAPGANGGRLSNAVRLDLQDVTGGSAIPVFAGRLGGLHTQRLGTMRPGESRTYRFTASLPDTGAPPSRTAGDNAFAGSGLTTRYVWTTSAPAPDGTGAGSPVGGSGISTGGGTRVRRPMFSLRVVSARLLSRGWLDVFVRCERSCGLTASATLRGVSHGRIAYRYASLPLPDRTARIRLRLRKGGRVALRRALLHRARVVVRVRVRVVPVAGTTFVYSRTVVVRRPKPGRR